MDIRTSRAIVSFVHCFPSSLCFYSNSDQLGADDLIMLRPRSLPIVLLVLLLVTLVYYRNSFYTNRDASAISWQEPPPDYKVPAGFDWPKVKANYPVTSHIPLPSSPAQAIPRIQHTSTPPTGDVAVLRKHRLNTVKAEFVHAWSGYKKHAWLQDEVAPLSGGVHNPFGGWAATLVDSLGRPLHTCSYSPVSLITTKIHF